MTLLQLIERDILAEGAVQMDLDARAAFEDSVDVFLEHRRRQAVEGYAPGDHAAEYLGELVDMHLEPGQGEILRRGQARRAAADNTDGLVARDGDGRQLDLVAQALHDKTLEIADTDRAVAFGAPADIFARCRTDPRAGRAERVGRGDRLVGFLQLLFPDQRDIGRRVGADRAAQLTGCGNKVLVSRIVRELERIGRLHGQVFVFARRHVSPRSGVVRLPAGGIRARRATR